MYQLNKIAKSFCCITTFLFVKYLCFLLNINHLCVISVREQLKDLTKQYDKSENDLKALQSVGQIVGEVLKQLTEEKCKFRRSMLLIFAFKIFNDCFSYCESYERAKICSWMSETVG